jgi:hypothetical protein
MLPGRVEERFPVVREPPINPDRWNRKVVIEAAIPGWHPIRWWEERGVTNLPPRTIETQVDAIVECVKAGASVIHTHPRDPKDGLPRVHAPELIADIMDGAFAEVDFITGHHTWSWDFSKSRTADYISYTKELLERGKGNKYVQAALVMTMGCYEEVRPVHSRAAIQEGVKWMEANKIKPIYSVEPSAMTHLKRAVFDTGISRWKPYWLSLDEGKHLDDLIFADPWSYISIATHMSLLRQIVPEPDCFIGINPGGRNWLPVATVAILYGCELVRVGLEDIFWLYPHKNDISHKASETVEMIAKIVKDIGREVATVKEARARLGIELTTRK